LQKKVKVRSWRGMATCIACGLCVQIAERAREPLGLTFIGRGFAVRVGVPFNAPLAEALTRMAAECARACPTGALVLSE
jgi:NADH dehydrogenase/NADH:ubiquinone oxidoreductase subunit G